jgi:UDP-N-acetylmuramoyl-tripeptide--D-alanyl-D-alanine ligase
MKFFFRSILKYYLKFWAKLAILIHQPRIIVVAGSINKPFFKKVIAQGLKESGLKVRQNPKNFNTEIGLPLAILDLDSGYNSYKNWLPQIFKAPLQVFKSMPEFLILSLGSAQKGDMKYLLSIIKPEISVITDITQRHLEGYQNMNELAQEYAVLVSKMKKQGIAVLNLDNPRVQELKEKCRTKVNFFSLSQRADCYVQEIAKNDQGQSFTLAPDGLKKQDTSYGRHHIQAIMAWNLIKKYVAKTK